MFSEAKEKMSRRKMLGITAAGAAGVVAAACTASPAAPATQAAGTAAAATKAAQAAPAAQGKTYTWKVQSGWPTTDWHFTNLKVMHDYITEMSGGRLKFDMLGVGTVVPLADQLEAASKGLLDACHTNMGFHYGKNVALGLFSNAGGGPFGMNAEDFLGWYYIGGGAQLYTELVQGEMKLNIVSFPTFGETPEPLGWFDHQIKTIADLKGLKFRAAGLAADVFKEFGMPVASVAPGDIVPALERKTLDASEYSDPTADLSAGFPEVRKFYHMPGLHQPTGTMELAINKAKFEEIGKELQAIVKYAAMAETLDFTCRMLERNAVDLQKMVDTMGVTVVQTPNDILLEVLKAWDKVADKYSKENATFAKIYASQKTYAKKVVNFRRAAHPDYKIAADFYWKNEDPYKVVRS